MNILFLSNAPWLDTNSVGNTLSNWFSEWDNTKICSVYTREAMPDNKCCQSYFQVTIGNIARHFFMRKRIGKIFQPKNILGKFSTSTSESKMVISTKGWKKKVILPKFSDILRPYPFNVNRSYIFKNNGIFCGL